MSITRNVFSNFIWSVLSELLGKGTIVVTNLLLVRNLGAEVYADFLILQTIIYVLWIVVDLGIDVYGLKEISAYREKKIKRLELFNIFFSLRIITGIVVFLISNICTYLIIGEQGNLFFLLSLYLIFYSINIDWFFKGVGNFKDLFFSNILASIVLFLVIAFFVKTEDDISTAALAFSITPMFSSVCSFFFFRNKYGKIRITYAWKSSMIHLKESIYLTLASSLGSLYHYIPLFLSSLYLSKEDTGAFGSIFRFILSIGTGILVIHNSFFPELSYLWGRRLRKDFSKLRRRFLILSLIFGGFLYVFFYTFSGIFIVFLFGESFNQRANLFTLLIGLVPLYIIRNCFRVLLISRGLHKITNIAFIAGLFIVIIAGTILIPKYGITSTAIVLLFAELTIGSFMFIFESYKNKIN